MLLWLLVVPLIGAVILLMMPNTAAKMPAVIVGGIEVVLFFALWAGPRQGIDWPWILSWGIRFHLGADGLSLFLLGLTSVVFLFALMASDQGYGRIYYFWVLFLEFATMGLFVALDLFLFYIFWEILLIPIFFLLIGWGGANRRRAAMKWLVMNLVGSLFMLIGIIAIAVIHSQVTGQLTFEIGQLAGTVLPARAAPWIFISFFVAFAIKAPIWPVHGWMPDAYGDSPAPITAILSGVLSKAGIYGILRVMLPLFGPQFRQYQTGLLVLAAVGLVYGALIALRQQDMKMVTAYGSLSHMSMMALGIFSLTSAGILGTTYYMVAHGLMVGGMFLVMGLLENRTGTREFSAMQGLNRSAPRLAAYFLFFALGSLGLPGLPGFAGEYMIIQGLVGHDLVFAIIAGIVVTVAAWYMLRVFLAIMQGPAQGQGIPDLKARQVSWLVPLAGAVVVLGVYPAVLTLSAVPSLYHAVHLVALGGGIGR